MKSTQWTRFEAEAHQEKLSESYNQIVAEISAKELESVGNYNIHYLIGRGSFGKVYLASHKLINGTKVVLKSASREDPHLAREIHHHRQFVHPHIARLYEVIVTEKLVWLVLEYCPGDELLSRIAENGKFEVERAQRVFSQLLGAVTYIHARKCVHRDLKLENILLDKNGNVKLVDFGFTRDYGDKNGVLQTWCGTVCYSPPEMLHGERYLAEKVDVWSMGVILYALLTGELPFDADDEVETRRMIAEDEPKFADHIPEPAQKLIKRLLSKRPLLRPTLQEVMMDPWLAEYTAEQRSILNKPPQPLFSTDIEHDTLWRMKTAGVNINQLMENAAAKRCDPLSGWWTLLLEKEVRKAARRERRLNDRSRRVSLGPDRSNAHSRVDTSRSRRSSRFGSENAIMTPNADTSFGQRSSTLPNLQVPDSPAIAVKRKEAEKAGGRINNAVVPEDNEQQGGGEEEESKQKEGEPSQVLSVSSTSPAVSPSKDRTHVLPLLGHLKQWLRQTTRKDTPPSSANLNAPEKKRLLFAPNGFRLYRERKRGVGAGESKIELPLVSSATETDITASTIKRVDTRPKSSLPTEGLESASVPARPASAATKGQVTRGRTAGSRLEVPGVGSTLLSTGVSSKPTTRGRSTSCSSPLQAGPSRRLSQLHGRKSTSSSLSSIRSMRPRPSHSKASSTSSTTTTTVTVGNAGMPLLSPAGVPTTPVPGGGVGSLRGRNLRLASPTPVSALPWKGRNLSGSYKSNGSSSTPFLTVNTNIEGSLFTNAGIITSPRARKRPDPLRLSDNWGRPSPLPMSPALAMGRKRSNGLASPLSIGLGLSPTTGPSSSAAFFRARRRKSGRGAMIVEEESELEEVDEGQASFCEVTGEVVEEVEEFDELEPGDEVEYVGDGRDVSPSPKVAPTVSVRRVSPTLFVNTVDIAEAAEGDELASSPGPGSGSVEVSNLAEEFSNLAREKEKRRGAGAGAGSGSRVSGPREEPMGVNGNDSGAVLSEFVGPNKAGAGAPDGPMDKEQEGEERRLSDSGSKSSDATVTKSRRGSPVRVV